MKRTQSLSFPASITKAKRATTPSSHSSSVSAPTPGSTTDDDPMSVSIGEPLMSDYSVHESPLQKDEQQNDCSTALAVRVELLEAEARYLRSLVHVGKATGSPHFRIEQIANNNSLIKFYTGFTSYSLLLNFFEFLGPAVYKLKYWGDHKRITNRRRKSLPLSALNQFF